MNRKSHWGEKSYLENWHNLMHDLNEDIKMRQTIIECLKTILTGSKKTRYILSPIEIIEEFNFRL